MVYYSDVADNTATHWSRVRTGTLPLNPLGPEDDGASHMDNNIVTNEQIEQLRTEAGTAGDLAMSAICDIALAGYPDERTVRSLSGSEKAHIDALCPTQGSARSECERVIAEGWVVCEFCGKPVVGLTGEQGAHDRCGGGPLA